MGHISDLLTELFFQLRFNRWLRKKVAILFWHNFRWQIHGWFSGWLRTIGQTASLQCCSVTTERLRFSLQSQRLLQGGSMCVTGMLDWNTETAVLFDLVRLAKISNQPRYHGNGARYDVFNNRTSIRAFHWYMKIILQIMLKFHVDRACFQREDKKLSCCKETVRLQRRSVLAKYNWTRIFCEVVGLLIYRIRWNHAK